MSDYIIEENIAIPEFTGRTKYPFREMKVGHSFGVNGDEIVKVRNAAGAYGRVHGIKLSVRRTEDGSHRCWRIA